MKKAWITIGVSASGKSTWAKEFTKSFINEFGGPIWEVNRDNFRRKILIDRGLQPDDEDGVRWTSWKWSWEKLVNDLIEERLQQILSKEQALIVSDTNLNPKYRTPLIQRLKDAGYEVEIVEFPISFKEACERDAARINGVGVSVIAKQMDEWTRYLTEEGRFRKFVPNDELPNAIICDIDGTLAHMVDRGPFEWDKVITDEVDPAVRALLDAMNTPENIIILLSGRDSVCENQTREWLEMHGVDYNFLFMRKLGDMRPDVVVKSEIFWKSIDGNFNPIMVIDDRPVICRMWRDMGLKVFQVGNPYIEF